RGDREGRTSRRGCGTHRSHRHLRRRDGARQGPGGRASGAVTRVSDRPLAEFTTLRVGGPARELVEPATREELVQTALEVWSTGDDWLVLGGGSNVLIADEGFDGTVIRVAARGID